MRTIIGLSAVAMSFACHAPDLSMQLEQGDDASNAAVSTKSARSRVGIAGKIQDVDGRPVPDAVVAAFPVGSELLDARAEAFAISNADGRYSLKIQADKEYAVTVTAVGKSPAYVLTSELRRRGGLASANAVVGSDAVREIRGRLRTHDGHPAASGTIQISPTYAERREQEIYLVLPGPEGDFRVSLPKSRYMLLGRAPAATQVVDWVDVRT
jgi:hypothetical protein